MIAFFAMLWRFIVWMWSALIIGIAAGVLGNLIYNYFTMGNITFADPRTLTVVSFIQSHLIPIVLILTFILLFTLFAYLAHLSEQRKLQEQQQAHSEALIDVAKGVRTALERLSDKSTTSPPPSPPAKTVPTSEQTSSTTKVWNVPFRRNPFFTGREDILEHLHDTLSADKPMALTQPTAISGLGGIGKTQTAVEYAYRYRDEYQYVLWARAETHEGLVSDCVIIAGLLNLPEKDEKDQGYLSRWCLC